jgi:hypothetical protein
VSISLESTEPSEHPTVTATAPAEPVPADTPTVISVHEVALGTAAALLTPPRRTSARWITMLRTLVGPPQRERRPRTQHVPPRCRYLEGARMERAMERL